MPTTTCKSGLAAAACLLMLLGGCASFPTGDPAYASATPAVPPPPAPANGAIYQAGYAVSLFEDLSARRVGDVLTIRLVERTDASKKASTSVNKESAIAVPNPILLGRPLSLSGGTTLETDIASAQDFQGEGDSSQSNSLRGDISVTVAEVLPNGNLLVRGEKQLKLNQGDEYIRLSGIVRPVDIAPDNTVLSTRVADVRIAYAGRGAVADASTLGWLSRFFLSMLWPF